MTIFYGEPRFTNDIDIVVELPADAVQEFCRQSPADDFYLSEHAASDAVRRCSQFNIIQPTTGLKVDVIVPQPSEFNRTRFARTTRVQAGDDWDALFSSPEDAIVKKMELGSASLRQCAAPRAPRLIGELRLATPPTPVIRTKRPRL